MENTSASTFPSERHSLLGKTVSHYEITRVLGAGAMGEVYAARDTLLGRNVAIKILHSRGRASEERKQRFLQEARAASALNHPNIITIHDVVRDGEVDCIVMELVSGQTLRARMLHGPLPLEETLDVLDRIADALAAAHAGGIVHRDLKPANVMLTASGGLKILDFGLAKLVANIDALPEGNPLTQSGAVVGTPVYMSPEQVLGETLDGRSDLFSIGSIGVEMLTGRNPFESDSVVSTLHEIAYGAPPSFEDVPGNAVPIFERLLERDKDERYQSADDLRNAIAQVRSGLAQTASLRVRPARQRIARRRRIGVIAFGVLMVIAIGIAAAQLWRTGANAAPTAPSRTTAAVDPFRPPPTAHSHVRHANELLSTPWRQGYIQKAIDELQRAVALDPNHAPAHVAMAKAYWINYQKQKDEMWLDLALGNARHAVELNPQLAAAHAVLGGIEFMSGNVDTARKELEQALVIDPGNALAHRWLSEVAFRGNDYARAEAEVRKAVELESRNPNLYNALGLYLYRRARYGEAEDAFRKEMTFAPDHAQSYRNVAGVLHMRGDYAGAARLLQQSLEIEPEAITYTNLGTLYFFQGLYPQSVTAFEKAVQLGANRHVSWSNLGDGYRWTPGNRAKAHDAFTTAVRLVEDELRANPDDPELQARKALYLAKQGDARGALAAADALMTRKELDPQSLYDLALAYEFAGARPKSLDALARAIRNGYPTKDVKSNPELVSLRRDVRYQRLMATVR